MIRAGDYLFDSKPRRAVRRQQFVLRRKRHDHVLFALKQQHIARESRRRAGDVTLGRISRKNRFRRRTRAGARTAQDNFLDV